MLQVEQADAGEVDFDSLVGQGGAKVDTKVAQCELRGWEWWYATAGAESRVSGYTSLCVDAATPCACSSSNLLVN